MERNFYTDDFEQLIRQKADQYKMYPSDHVWKGVYKALHGRRRWYWGGMALLLLSIGVFTADYLFTTTTARLIATNLQPTLTAVQESAIINDQRNVPLAAINRELTTKNAPQTLSGQANRSVIMPVPESSIIIFNTLPESNIFSGNTAEIINEIASLDKSAKTENELIKTTTSDTEATDGSVAEKKQGLENGVNWLQEYAVYQFSAPKVRRINLMLHFSPTINYRKLTGNGAGYDYGSEIQSVPLAMNFNGEVDQYVNHKPAFGFELGSSFLYRASKLLNIKAGIQFNYSRYNIEAYSSQREKATIALNANWNADTMVSYTSVRNMSGVAPQELANQYFQVSLPVGLELRLLGNEKIQLNVAGTIQPTYLINANSYLITTDYRNYTKEPSLVRKWNVNAGVETYFAYHTGTVRWQLGPQFRYQLLSSYVNKYPIKEYLMEYGFKIGVSKTIR